MPVADLPVALSFQHIVGFFLRAMHVQPGREAGPDRPLEHRGELGGFERFALDAESGMLFQGVEPTLLGRRAVALLRLLLERAPVGKEALIEAAWPGLGVEDSNLTVQIAALRRVLAQDNGVVWIETLPRHGYRYVGPPVTRVEESAGEPAQRSDWQIPAQPSIAVLPFENTGDAAWFADGVVNDIITGLSRIKWLFVIARSSSFKYRGDQ